MPPISFQGVAVVAAVGFFIPLFLGFFPRIRIPSIVLEIVAGIVIGPSVLGWVKVDPAIHVISIIGMATLLFLGGMEIEYHRLKGKPLILSLSGFAISLVIGIAFAWALFAVGLIASPLFVGILLSATAIGVVIPILKDTHEITTDFGQLVVAGASIADFGTVILLTLFFSREATNVSGQLILLAAFVALAIATVIAATKIGHSKALSSVFLRLQDTTAQIRVRGAAMALLALVAVAERFGLETILGAFIAGSVLKLIDNEGELTHPLFRTKLEAIGFGVFVPVFFVTSGLKFNLGALLSSPGALMQIPLYLLGLLVVRGIPAAVYRSMIGTRRSVAAGFLQATTLSFVVAGVQIGLELKVIDDATGAALMASALLSVLIFPLCAAIVLQGAKPVK